jgi:dihydrofolate reductase
MPKLSVFNHISIDGYFCDRNNSMEWAHRDDPEMQEFAGASAQGAGPLIFGRKTYELMKSFWPTEAGRKDQAVVSEQMTKLPKFVFSRTMKNTDWENTTILKGDPVDEIPKLKKAEGPDLTILGSGSIVQQLAAAKLIDSYALMLNPILLGAGRTMFEGLPGKQMLKLVHSQPFKSGNILLTYEPA